MLLALPSAGFQSLLPLPTSKLDPSDAGSWWVGLCRVLDPLGPSSNSLVRLGVSPTAAPSQV